MGSEELLGRIKTDAREKVAEVAADRDRQVAEIGARAGAEVKRLEDEFRARIELETKQSLERARSRARLEERKELLRARWQVIELVFERARERLLDDPEYPGLLKTLAERYGGKSGTVRLAARDRERFGSGLGVKAETAAGISGGLLVEEDRRFLDFSVEESLGAIRDELAPKLARQLFPRPGN